MATRVRRNVFELGQWSSELTWYGRAVTEMLSRPLDDPTSWRYIAAVHGRMSGGNPDPYAKDTNRFPEDAPDRWDQCQHQTWFFLPWHRGYLAAFEAAVSETIRALGGPADWALPYWDYSADQASRIMPHDFYEPQHPDDGDNPLWNPWGRPPDGDVGLTDALVSLDCLTYSAFAGSNDGAAPGFGGPITGFMHFGWQVNLPSGWVEDVPHNGIHDQIGGLMGHPDYAALDPIFWLHHANIDRLWDLWRQRRPGATPTDQSWLRAVRFELHDGSGQLFKFRAEDMLDTSRVLHGYTYDSLELAQPIAPRTRVSAMASDQRTRQAELAGANDASVSLAGGQASTRVSIRPAPRRLRSLVSDVSPLRAYLNLEHITGQGSPGNYEVYVQVGEGAPRLAGVMSTFGVEKASAVAGGHGGNGLDRVIEITPLIKELGLTAEREQDLHVTFKKLQRAKTPQLLPIDTTGDTLKIGRVSVYFA